MNKFRSFVKELFNDLFYQLNKIKIRLVFRVSGLFKRTPESLLDKTILVYTMGKVGSTSIFYSFLKKFPNKEVFHLHFLSDFWLKGKLVDSSHKRNIYKAQPFFRYLSKHKDNHLKVISIVREPISRDISDYFQNFRLENNPIKNKTVPEICAEIKSKGHSFPDEWISTDLKEYLNYDIYNTQFDKDKGYSIYQINEKTSLLLIRLDRLNKIHKDAFDDFFGWHFDELYNFNEGSQKKTAIVNKQVKNAYKLSAQELDEVYSSKYMTYFYTDEEISEFKKKWQK